MGKPVAEDNKQSLTVIDNRTGKEYRIPIKNNSIPATAFKAMSLSNPASASSRPEDDEITGIRVFDPGFQNTATIQSRITYIDGEKGVLRYRGYPIEQLAEKSNFLESAYLLIYGELPTQKQYTSFYEEIMHHTYTHVDVDRICSAFRYDAHPMSIMMSTFAALGAFAPEANPALAGQRLFTYASGAEGKEKQEEALKNMDKQIFRMIGKAITVAAAAFRHRQGRPFNRPPAGMGYTEAYLYMLDHLGETNFRPHPTIAKALDILFLCHADHEVNASTATMLQTGSTLVDPYSAVSASISALYGPLHGGACEAVVRMLEEIGKPENVPQFLEQVKKKQKVLSGFGHRVYRTTDPRSYIIRKTAEEIFALTGSDKLLDTAKALYEAANSDEYFTSRRLGANVDFWSGLIYRSLGFPTDYYPVLFAVPRVVGWLAHWRQMMLQPGGVKIWRPRQLYIGEGERNYAPLEQRKEKENQDPTSQPAMVAHFWSKRNFLADYDEKSAERKLRMSKL
ncbi:citrate synthase [Atractiella rhizophila]|nr:citrate synthase [Atractiella rhizophila]